MRLSLDKDSFTQATDRYRRGSLEGMMWIELTKSDGTKAFLNMDHFISISADGSGSALLLAYPPQSPSSIIRVTETPAQVMVMIEAAIRAQR